MSRPTQAVTHRAHQALIRVIRANPAAPVDRARVNRSRASPNQVNQNRASLNRANRIRREKANRTPATAVTANRTAQATRDHPAVAIPARAIRVEATAANPIVQKVNRLVRKARASRKANRIPKIRAAIADRYRVTRGRAIQSQVPRSPVTPVAAGLPRRVNPAKARVNRKASRKANQLANRDQRASHRAAMGQKANPAAIGQVTAKVKAIASHGPPAIPPAVLVAIRRAFLAADQRAAQAVTRRHRQAIRMIHRQATRTIHPPASRIVRA